MWRWGGRRRVGLGSEACWVFISDGDETPFGMGIPRPGGSGGNADAAAVTVVKWRMEITAAPRGRGASDETHSSESEHDSTSRLTHDVLRIACKESTCMYKDLRNNIDWEEKGLQI